jgi:uncharacterized surface protein with fasciclin (FAS1) repeats
MGWCREHAEDVRRTGKYAFLFVALSFTIVFVFSGFSNYLSRRSFEADLEGKNAPNFELLEFMSRRERALAVATLETRCLERTEFALFRLVDAKLRQRLNDAYFRSLELRSKVFTTIDKIPKAHPEWANIVDLPDLKKSLPSLSSLSRLEILVRPKAPMTSEDPQFRDVSEQVVRFILDESSEHFARLREYDDVPAEVENIGKNVYFKNIQLLEARLDNLRAQRIQNRKTLGIDTDSKTGTTALGDVLARYTAWKEGQLGAADDNPVLDEIAVDLTIERVRPANLNCDRFDQFVASATDRPPFAFLRFASASYKMPLIAQTLLVTLFLGAMGAFTINVLRLSKIGWWKEQEEPVWGELVLSPFVGALAAFCIFLLGSTGLLLTSDVKAGQSGVTSLSAFFIGLLGFVSGLLYDEAFGRVRRFGSQLFGADDPTAIAAVEDRSLAEALRAAKASYVAELVLKFGIGKRISSEAEFTLLVPSDEAMSRLTLQAWKEISEPMTRSKFETWFRRHHATKRVSKSDVAAGNVTELQVEAENTKYAVAIDGDDLTVKGVKVVKADIKWENGVIHILQEDVT